MASGSLSSGSLSSNSLSSVPPQILCCVLRAADNFGDLLALASTCKTVHAVWTAHAPEMIWERGCKEIISFDSALIAVGDRTHFWHVPC